MSYKTFELRFEGCVTREQFRSCTIRMTPNASFAIPNRAMFPPLENAQSVCVARPMSLPKETKWDRVANEAFYFWASILIFGLCWLSFARYFFLTALFGCTSGR
jgi:hypothetical protein